jgi:hypothetical protein
MFSIDAAIDILVQMTSTAVDSIYDFMGNMEIALDLLWSCQDTWSSNFPSRLVSVYSNLIDKLPRLAGFALDASLQLSILELVGSIGSDACTTALLSGYHAQAIELLDHAHGVVWSQALHQRNPQFQDVPESLSSELERLLHTLAAPRMANPLESSTDSGHYLTSKDMRHEQNNRVQEILSDIRTMPGLERFMLGHTFETLSKAAGDHPIAVLVAARGHVFVLIISDQSAKEPYPLRLSCSSQKLSMLCDAAGQTGLRGVTATPNDLDLDATRAMHISSRPKDNAQTVLAELWRHIVKPVVDYLQLQVRPTQICQ